MACLLGDPPHCVDQPGSDYHIQIWRVFVAPALVDALRTLELYFLPPRAQLQRVLLPIL